MSSSTSTAASSPPPPTAGAGSTPKPLPATPRRAVTSPGPGPTAPAAAARWRRLDSEDALGEPARRLATALGYRPGLPDGRPAPTRPQGPQNSRHADPRPAPPPSTPP